MAIELASAPRTIFGTFGEGPPPRRRLSTKKRCWAARLAGVLALSAAWPFATYQLHAPSSCPTVVQPAAWICNSRTQKTPAASLRRGPFLSTTTAVHAACATPVTSGSNTSRSLAAPTRTVMPSCTSPVRVFSVGSIRDARFRTAPD